MWAFAVPSMIGFVAAFVFYWLFRELDNEDFFVHVDDVVGGERGSSEDEESTSLDEKTGAVKTMTVL